MTQWATASQQPSTAALHVLLLTRVQLFGQRGKHDLVGLNLDFAAAMDFIQVTRTAAVPHTACMHAWLVEGRGSQARPGQARRQAQHAPLHGPPARVTDGRSRIQQVAGVPCRVQTCIHAWCRAILRHRSMQCNA